MTCSLLTIMIILRCGYSSCLILRGGSGGQEGFCECHKAAEPVRGRQHRPCPPARPKPCPRLPLWRREPGESKASWWLSFWSLNAPVHLQKPPTTVTGQGLHSKDPFVEKRVDLHASGNILAAYARGPPTESTLGAAGGLVGSPPKPSTLGFSCRSVTLSPLDKSHSSL